MNLFYKLSLIRLRIPNNIKRILARFEELTHKIS